MFKQALNLGVAVIATALLGGCRPEGVGGQVRNPLDEPVAADYSASQNETAGYGGDVLVCGSQSAGYTVEMFDLYEARLLRNSIFLPETGDPYDVATAIIGAVKARHPGLGAKFETELAFFKTHSRFVAATLKDVPDQGPVVFEPECTVAQAAIRIADPLPGDPEYIVDQRLWAVMDVRNQAALLLHEIIYRHAVGQGYVDSQVARLFNAHVNADGFATQTEAGFRQLLFELVLDPTTVFTAATGAVRWSDWQPGGDLSLADAASRCGSKPGFMLENSISADRSFFKTSALGRTLLGQSIWAHNGLDSRTVMFRYTEPLSSGEVWTYDVDPSTPHAYLCLKRRP